MYQLTIGGFKMHTFFWQAVEMGLGIQFCFWGLNGFMNWVKPPENDEIFSNFIGACYQVKYLMSSIKIIQIIAGLMLVSQFKPSIGLLLLTPIVFGISLLQIFHAKNPWPVLVPISIPFAISFINNFLPVLSGIS